MLSSIINYLFKKVMELPIIYNLGYKAVYFYSYCEIYANKYLLNKNNNKIVDSGIQIYKNGKKVDSVGHGYDLVIYNTKNVNNKNIHIIIPDIDYNVNSYYTLTNWKFVSMSINYLGDEYEINLSNPRYTYYIVNNIINKEFIAYYLTNYCEVDLSLDKDKSFSYTGIILDENMEVVSINENDSIKFSYDNYYITKGVENNINLKNNLKKIE